MTTSITLRATKGSPLTHNEVDANFTNLKTTADAAAADGEQALNDKANASAIGIAAGDANMGTFTGTTISDNGTAKAALQELETAVEAATAAKANASAVGISASASNMGTYTGSTIPDNETAKQNIQSLETAVETKANAAAVGVAASAANMGTYTGSTIPDNETAKQNIQSLETAVETKAPSASPTFSGIARNGSWPNPVNSIATTANTTNGNPTITVADGSQVSNGDAIFASFATQPAYVVSGGGTNTIVMSRNASATGTGTAVTFGNDRWDLSSTTVGDTAGYRRVYVGQAAKGRSTIQPQINGQGLDYSQVTAFACENENGGAAGWFASRMSLENTGLSAIISLGTYTLIDEDPVSRHAWNRYEQSVLLAGTDPSGTGQFIGVEASVQSYWTTVDIDPYTVNPAGSVRIYRLDPGIGAVSGWSTPNDISALMDFVPNTGKARKGLVFGDGTLNTTANANPAAIAFPQAYAITWFSGASNEAFKIFSTATSGSDYLWHNGSYLIAGECDISVTKNSTSASKLIQFSTANSARWSVGSTATSESGGNAGSDFAVARFSDAGSYLGLPLSIRRSNGQISMGELQASTSYASDAAAAAGGVAVGELYRNGSVVQIRIT